MHRKEARTTFTLITLGVIATIGLVLPTFGSARGDGNTKVTVASWPDGLFGYVKSPQQRCAKERTVKVFKQLGKHPNPDRDKLVGKDVTSRNGGGFQWTQKQDGTGRFYAKAGKVKGCKAGRSSGFHVRPRAEVPSCPSNEPVCQFDLLDLSFSTFCRSFSKSSGDCSNGDAESGDVPWSPSDDAFFEWNEDKPGTSSRSVTYRADNDTNVAELNGRVPGPGSDRYTITDAEAFASPTNPGWRTPDLPNVPAGQQGGPLHLDFENGTIGADIFIRGFLYKR